MDPVVHYFVSAKDPNGPELDLDKSIGELGIHEAIMKSSKYFYIYKIIRLGINSYLQEISVELHGCHPFVNILRADQKEI